MPLSYELHDSNGSWTTLAPPGLGQWCRPCGGGFAAPSGTAADRLEPGGAGALQQPATWRLGGWEEVNLGSKG